MNERETQVRNPPEYLEMKAIYVFRPYIEGLVCYLEIYIRQAIKIINYFESHYIYHVTFIFFFYYIFSAGDIFIN